MKVRGACDKPFRIYRRMNNCAPLRQASDDVLVVEDDLFYIKIDQSLVIFLIDYDFAK